MKLHLSKKELDNEQGSGGLEITIEGIQGDPADKCPGTSVFIEKYEGNIQLHVWSNNQQDCQTIILTPPKKKLRKKSRSVSKSGSKSRSASRSASLSRCVSGPHAVSRSQSSGSRGK